MTARYLLDTNIFSEPLKPEPDNNVLQKLKQHKAEIVCTSIVMQEIIFGCYCLPPSKRRDKIEAYFQQIQQTITILPYDNKAGEWQDRERAKLRSKGLTPPFIDSQIAAVAVTNNLILVTRNTNDFTFFEDLKLENWFE